MAMKVRLVTFQLFQKGQGFSILPFAALLFAACGELSYSKVPLWAEAFLQRRSPGTSVLIHSGNRCLVLCQLAAMSPEDAVLGVVFLCKL